MDENSTFVSCFKINNIPILPPVITEELKKELQYYREKAIEIEKRIAQLQRFPESDLVVEDLEESFNLIQLDAPTENPDKQEIMFDADHPDSLEHLDIVLRNDDEKIKVITETEQLKTAEHRASETISLLDIDSNIGPAQTDGTFKQLETEENVEKDSEKFSMINCLLKEESSQHIDANDEFLQHRRLIRSKSYTLESPSQLLLDHLTDNIAPAQTDVTSKQLETEENVEKNSENFPMINCLPKEESSQYIDANDEFLQHHRLIRSKSYTLESPSQLLLEHLTGKGISLSASAPEVPSQMSTSLPTSKINKIKSTSTVSKKLFPPIKTNTLKRNQPVNTLKNKRSPYDTKTKPNQKTLKKRKNQTNLDQKLLSAKMATPTKPKTPVSPIQLLDQKIVEFQDQYNRKMLELMRQQEEEHARMQEKFKHQQEELLSSVYLIKPSMEGNRPRTSTPMDINGNNQFLSSSYSNLSSSQTLNLSNTITDADESITSQNFYTCINQELENTKSHKSSSPLNRSLQINEYMEQIKQKYKLEQNYDLKIQNAAATKINALARGFLTRRLFKTELVQSHIQTIRDTLMFVLDLHYETENGPMVEKTDPADIFLKGRLLKQLQSACYKIHYIFFLSTIKQRMEIIFKDREHITTKRLSRSSSINSSRPRSNSNVTANPNVQNDLKNPAKLQRRSVLSASNHGDLPSFYRDRPHTAIPLTMNSKIQYSQNRPKTAIVTERVSKSPARPWR